MRVLAAVLLVFAVACGGPERSGRESATAASEAAPGEAPPASGTAGGAASTVQQDGAAPAGAGAGTAAEARSDPGQVPSGRVDDAPPAATGPARPEPATPGTYRYDTDGWSQIGDGPQRRLPAVTTLLADPPTGSRQRLVRDIRDQDGTGAVTEQVLDYQTDGVRLVSLRLKTNLGGIARTYSFVPPAPPLVLKAGPAPGDATSFEVSGDGVTVRTQVRVVAVEPLRVAGQVREVVVVDFVFDLTGDLEGRQSATNRIDTDASLTVAEKVASDVRQGAVRVRTSYTSQVQSIQPQRA